ncbi:ammonium transporter Mep1p [[Candida] railenensis]|uniref:Ammonium transporter Mep1p n=1 Tax=[Candida] railenensis TaxID=45579 RepID=A0A9P0QML0_9ASCO|nr:ammonium transporter Mep1p [[Candida] railenensis]
MSTEETFDTDTAVNTLFMLYCTSLMAVAILGVAFFYSGLTQRRSSLTMLGLPLLLTAFVFVDWFIWGYSLCYATASNKFIGSLNFAVLRHLGSEDNFIYSTPRGDILSFNHFLFNGIMKAICVTLTLPGCIAERGRIIPMLVFLFFWSCIIYNPVTYWFWNKNGFLSAQLMKLPVLDFAGGSPIHIVSGFTTLAYSYILGPRNPKLLYNYRNSNTGWIIVGAFLTLCGWVGFIAGCDYRFSAQSGYIVINTILCGAVSGIVWTSIDYYWSSIPFDDEVLESSTGSDTEKINIINSTNTGVAPDEFGRHLTPKISQTGVAINQHAHSKSPNPRRKISLISFCSGIMTGLVVITPGGGYVSSSVEFWKAIVFGVVGAIIANVSTRLKYFFKIDDALDIFAIHGVAGIAGSILTGIFSASRYDSEGGWVEGNWKQIGYQILGCVITSIYVFVFSCVLLYIIDYIPHLHLRIDKGFNKRMRKHLENSTKSTKDVEQQEHQGEHEDVESEGETLELLGTDNYEFNGEFSMDFMEFIKILRPDDYDDQDVIEGNENYHPNGNSTDNIFGDSSDFKLHSDHQGIINRRG